MIKAFVSWRLCIVLILLGFFGLSSQASSQDSVKIRVGALAFGTVNWELQTIQDHGLAKAEGIDLEIVPLAMKNAANIALQGGAVDIIVNDWIWVSRQRAAGRPYTFVPYSMAVGGVMVRPDKGIETLADLRDKRLGVAGGPVDKSWVLLRAYGKKTLGEDMIGMVEPVYGAPPLLNALMLKGELPAVLNFWHYGARLKAAGMRQLIGVADILPALGVERNIPLIGWVFDETWANGRREAVLGLLRASREAKRMLAESDAPWEALRPLMKADDEATFIALRDGYRAGIPGHFGPKDIEAAHRVFGILAQEGGEKLVGDRATLSPGTFWGGYSLGEQD